MSGFPLLMVFIPTEVFVPGSTAMFSNPPNPGSPMMPGPLIKNPKKSLNGVPTYSSYSSLAKVKLKRRLSPTGTTSNSRIQASKLLFPVIVVISGSPGVPFIVVAASVLFGPKRFSMFPVVRTIPSPSGKSGIPVIE